MCKYASHEQYTTCNHTIPCHLKYDITYCHNPNGIPLPTRAISKLLTEHGFRPSRSCDIDKWQATTLRVQGQCPACVAEARQRERAEVLGAVRAVGNNNNNNWPVVVGVGEGEVTEETEETGVYWDMPDMLRWFVCGHSKAWVKGESLQRCFYKGGSDGGEGKGEKGKKKKKKKKTVVDIGADVQIDMGDLRIAEFWGTEYLFSEEEAGKIRFEDYAAEGICGACWLKVLSKEEEEREEKDKEKEKEKEKKRLASKSKKLFGQWKGWMKGTFQEKMKREA
ncbi:hypothetical protein EMCG_04037 [[Emmonsia] crescens]|uniref:Uncharacterized protein n=1 Tax=[Emmonsia] crescens TaxID=73230 RepID=A0A0G2HUA8_9EURO|nr:hypothetical protein EMCG_04037 [Emmonsia crescens UAMH 3008]